jgi:DNA-directed RNA polymerase subunit H (RpoH/RPB5)
MAATNDAEMFQLFAKMTVYLHTVINYKESYMLLQEYHALLKGIFKKIQEKNEFKSGQKIFNRMKGDSLVGSGGSTLKRSGSDDSHHSGVFEESEISPERTPNIKNPDE